MTDWSVIVVGGSGGVGLGGGAPCCGAGMGALGASGGRGGGSTGAGAPPAGGGGGLPGAPAGGIMGGGGARPPGSAGACTGGGGARPRATSGCGSGGGIAPGTSGRAFSGGMGGCMKLRAEGPWRSARLRAGRIGRRGHDHLRSRRRRAADALVVGRLDRRARVGLAGDRLLGLVRRGHLGRVDEATLHGLAELDVAVVAVLLAEAVVGFGAEFGQRHPLRPCPDVCGWSRPCAPSWPSSACPCSGRHKSWLRPCHRTFP